MTFGATPSASLNGCPNPCAASSRARPMRSRSPTNSRNLRRNSTTGWKCRQTCQIFERERANADRARREPEMSEAATIDGSDVLIVVDVQNDFCPGGALAVPHGDEIVPIVNRLAARFHHVVLTQDWHAPGHFSFATTHPGKNPFETIAALYGPQVLWPDHCVQGTPGAAFHPALQIPHAALVLRKGIKRTID